MTFFSLLDKDVDSSGMYVATSNSIVLSYKYMDERTFFVICDINLSRWLFRRLYLIFFFKIAYYFWPFLCFVML